MTVRLTFVLHIATSVVDSQSIPCHVAHRRIARDITAAFTDYHAKLDYRILYVSEETVNVSNTAVLS